MGALFTKVPLAHPPLTVVDAKKLVHAEFICACVLHDGKVTSFPQVNVTVGVVIVNVALLVPV